MAPVSIGRSDDTDPAAIALTAERTTHVRAAVVALDEPYREAVVLRFFAQLSLEEISVATGRPTATIKTHLRRGLVRLRGAVEIEGAH